MAEPAIEKFELQVSMDATITVFDGAGNPTDWLKPGAQAKTTWQGVPSETELALRYRDMQQAIAVVLGDVVENTRKRLDEARRGG
jgi:hypothetical protein